MGKDVKEMIGNLSDEDMEKVLRLVTKLEAKGQAVEEHTEHKPKGRKSSGSGKSSTKGRKQPTQKVGGRGVQNRQAPHGGRGQKGSPARMQTFDDGGERPNRFVEEDMQKHQNRAERRKDAEIDGLLAGENILAERRDEIHTEEMQCQGDCGLWFDINPSSLHRDPDKGFIFYCNDCSSRGR